MSSRFDDDIKCMVQGTTTTLPSPVLAMRSPVAAVEHSQSANLGRNPFPEDTLSVCSSNHHAPPSSPVPGVYPSPYRASTAAAFADINRALDVRSLRNSVYTNFGTVQEPPKVTGPRPSLRPLSLSMRRADSNAPANRPDRRGHPASLRSHSLPAHTKKAMSSESEPDHLIEDDGDGDVTCTIQTSHKNCAAPGGGAIAKGRAGFPLSELGENRPPGRKDARKAAGGKAADGVVTSPNGKGSSKRTRATTCLIM